MTVKSLYIPMAMIAVIVAFLIVAQLCGRRDGRPEKAEERPKLWQDEDFLAALGRSGKRGAKGIVVVAPASGLDKENAGKAHEIADALGIRFPAAALSPGAVPYNANDDETRLRLLRDALADPEAEVIWAVRGGYGSSRLLAALADAPQPGTRKIFVGYSDMTFLHLFLQKWGWRTVHGAMFWELNRAGQENDAENFRLLAALLSGREKELRYTGLRPFNQAANNLAAPIEAPICGGNLTCLAAAAGTPWALSAAEKILLLEDQKEPGYKIDRMLTQLRQAGALDGAEAVILGEFTQGDHATEFALERFANSFTKPVFRTDLFGHGKKNYPIIFNSPAVIEKERDGDGTHGLRIAADTLP